MRTNKYYMVQQYSETARGWVDISARHDTRAEAQADLKENEKEWSYDGEYELRVTEVEVEA